MGHLSSEQLIDLAEGVELEPAPAAHLESCSRCRQQLADLRSTIAAVSEVEVPEPSPLQARLTRVDNTREGAFALSWGTMVRSIRTEVVA